MGLHKFKNAKCTQVCSNSFVKPALHSQPFKPETDKLSSDDQKFTSGDDQQSVQYIVPGMMILQNIHVQCR